MKCLIGIAGLLILMALSLMAQEEISLQGLITDDESGSPLPGARIRLIGSLLSAECDESGDFRFTSLSPGRYELEISHIGYKTRLISTIVSPAQPSWLLDIRLHPQPVELPEMAVSIEALPSAGPLSGARIITQEQLRLENSRDLADLLQKESLADVISDGSPGGAKSVSLRGSAADQVLVLLDGRPLNESSSGAADLARISLTEIKQVEIYPNSAPTLGAQGIGGVINIITLRPGAEETRLQTAISGYGERQGSIALGRHWGSWPFLGIFEHRESDGEYRYSVLPEDGLDVYTRNVGQTPSRIGAGYRRDLLSLKMDAAKLLTLGFRQSQMRRQNPDYLPLPILPHESWTSDDRQEFTVDMIQGKRWYRPALHLKAEAYQQQTSQDYGESYPLLNRSSRLLGEAYGAEVTWNRKWDWRAVASGTGLRRERLWSSDLESGSAERLHRFAFLQVQGEPFEKTNWPVHLGLFTGGRVDFYEGQRPFIHPHLGLELRGGDELLWSLRGEFSGAYHLPSFNALFWQEDLQARGNPNLRPERSLNREISGRLGLWGWELSACYFDRQVWDLIYWRLDFDDKWKPLNLYRARIYGTETGLRGRSGEGLGHIELSLMHRWMEAQNQSGEANTDQKWLPYRPRHSIVLSLKQDLRVITWDAAARWVSRRYTNEANTKSIPPYAVWDVGAGKSLRFSRANIVATLRGEIRNLFNRGYRLVEAAPMPLREWWIILSFEHLPISR